MFKVSAGTFIPHPHPCLNMVKVLGNLPKEEKHQKSDSRKKRNKDGWGWRRLKRIGNDDFEKFRLIFSKKFLKNWKERRQSPFNSWRYHVFARTLTWYFIGVYIINCFLLGTSSTNMLWFRLLKPLLWVHPLSKWRHIPWCVQCEKKKIQLHMSSRLHGTQMSIPSPIM